MANDLSASIWTAGFALAAGVHLWLHPQRTIFLEALRLLTRHPLVLLMITLCHAVAVHHADAIPLPTASVMVWPDSLLDCVSDGAMQFGWLFLDTARCHEFMPLIPRSLWWHSLWQGGAAAIVQVGLCLLCLGKKNAELTLRWRNLVLLALIITLLNAGTHLMNGKLQWCLMLETLIVAAPLPYCIATMRESFASTGGFMLLLWRVLWPSWAGFAITAVLLLALYNHAARILALHPGVMTWFINAAISGLFHFWIFAAGVLLMRRAGYLVRPTTLQ
ncbi:MAG: hypothetical protein WCN98_11335 [Verrucomicrobiaceae bacterium]